MKKRICSVLLVLVLTLAVLLPTAQAVSNGIKEQGIREILKTKYDIAPGVTEYAWLLNNNNLTEQMVGHVMEVKVGSGSTASIAVGYSDDNIETIKNGKSWAMKETTLQAGSMQNRRSTETSKINVVGAINAGGYDMSNGRPSGAFIMNGTQINAATGTTFWIDKNGNAHITNMQECNVAYAAGNVMEAVASFGDIFEDGHAKSGLDDATRASRTAIGIKKDGTVVMLMVDGRQAPYSVGMTMAEVGAAMEELGCVQAINLDGGGSSTFATQREGEPESADRAGLTLRCRPSDGYERKVSNTIMVLSTAQPTGEFHHAVLTPNGEVYTPGSTVQFSASGVDAAGGSAEIPADASWEVLYGGGSISASGLYTAAADTTGAVTVGLTSGGKTLGQTSIQLQWPDKLDFTNTSVSIDFGKTSDLTFKPTWQGREVHYKDGDFVWSLDENGLTYKSTVLIDPKAHNAAGHYGGNDMYLSLNGDLETVKSIEYSNGNYTWYLAHYKETQKSVSIDSDGYIKVMSSVDQLDGKVWFYQYVNGQINRDEIELQKELSEDELLKNQSFTSTVGRFVGNNFIADESSSLRATVKVSLSKDSTITGSVDVVVGMEPYVLMDFEDHGNVSATEYWKCHVGASSTGVSSHLTAQEVKEKRVWIRDTTNKGVIFPDGCNRIVSAEEDENVRFGQYAFKLGYNFKKVDPTAVAVADFGFSGDLYVQTVQPTKIGMWVNVPAECAGDTSVLKALMKGNAKPKELATAYMVLNEGGTMDYVEGYELVGTATYVQYYGTAQVKNETTGKMETVTLTTLGDMAGLGWIWVEADISAFQMPVDVSRAYTVRVTSPQNCTKGSGYLYIDNLQFIYGTNANDVTRPVLESVTETSSNTVLQSKGTTVLAGGNLTFNAVYSDSELTDKYATGIDQSGIRVLLDGTDYTDDTDKVEINDGTLYLKNISLRNGTHTLTIRLKDFYGNVTTETRTFRVEDSEGVRSAIDIVPQPELPEIGKEFAFAIVNNTGETVTKAELTVDFSAMGNAAAYLAGAKAESLNSNYEVKLDEEALKKGLAKITVQKKVVVQTFTARQSESYDYVSELGYLILTIPANAASDSELRCTVTKGSYTLDDGSSYTFSGEEKVIALSADYQLLCEQAIAGIPTELTVTDGKGTTISRAEIYQVGSDGTPTKLGSTNLKGTFEHTFDTAGEYTFYAVKTGGGRSWNQRVIVCEKTQENDGKPFGILTNGVSKAGTKSITWLTQIDGSEAKAQVKYSTTEDFSGVNPVEGTSALQTFVQSKRGDALRSNKVTLTGLMPGTTYYYQVGDGATWSATQSFTMPAADKAATDFFILGDIQTADTANLARVLDGLKASSTSYDFAIQTGDAIDNVTVYSNWRSFLTTVNGNTLNGVDLVHVLGNHEYYGDADGEISKAIYDLPESAQNSWYKMEYGKVCVVVVNNGVKLSETLADIAENLTTDCIWKVLVVHEPIYGTESVSATTEILSNIEKAGFDFVFGGDDHAYARTYPMIGGVAQKEDSRNGVVYYVCGDLSGKSNEFHERDIYAKAIAHNDYTGMYLTVQATDEAFTVKAVQYDGKELDTYTKRRTECELGKHTVNSTSKYDMTAGTITCAVCNTALEPRGDYMYPGLLSTTDGKQVILANGVPEKEKFVSFGERYHACADGYAYLTQTTDGRTCVAAGDVTHTCPECEATEILRSQRPGGHVWNENHVCTVCQTVGIDINSADIVFKFGSAENPREVEPAPNYYYTGSGVRPGTFAKRGDYVLTQRNDANLVNGRIPDMFVEWPDSKDVGKAEVKLHGQGDYYGEKTLIYYIVPNDVKNLALASAAENTLNLTWDAAPGAGYYEVFQCDKDNSGSSRKSLGTTAETSFTVGNLNVDTEYYFVVVGRAEIPAENDRIYSSPHWSNILCARTAPVSANVTAMTATVDGVQIPAISADGANYLFLPASADLESLAATFTRSADEGNLVVTGNQGSQSVSGGDALNVSALASETDGYRSITAKVGNGDGFTVRVMQATSLPTLYLTSSSAAENRTYIDASKTNTTTAALRMLDAAGDEIGVGNIKELKARGNSTFTYAEKKSYQIKLETAADLLQTGESVKTWVLLANYFDATLMHDKLFKDMATQLDMHYTASCNWVNLYYDGEYRGVYLLSEKNAVKSTGVDITDMEKAYEALNEGYGTDKQTATGNANGVRYTYTTGLTEPENITGGYLLELNHSEPDEVSGFITKQGKGVNVKSPEWCGESAMQYISGYYQAFEDAVYAVDDSGAYTGYNESTGKYYYEYVDRDSLVKIFLMQELALNPDGFISSLYFYKDADGIMYAGPIWDQDMTLGTGWSKQISPDTTDYHYLAEALIQIPDFRAAVNSYYTEHFAPLANRLIEEDGTIAEYEALLMDSAEMNFVLWPYIRIGNPTEDGHIWQNATYAGVVADMQSWLTSRIAKLDSTFAEQVFEVGDVNMDAKVDTSDAVLILRYALGYQDEGFNVLYGDLNGDGFVDTSDAVLALRRALGYVD